MLLSLIICFLIVIIDQITKFCFYGMSCSLIGDFLWFESTLNTGASFGMMQGATTWFIVFSIPFIVLMFWVICSKKYNFTKFFKASLAVILGGTIGNLIDRFIYGGVRDFIYFKSINFAIFNVADIAINVGVIMLLIYIIIYIIKSPNKNKAEEEAKKQQEQEKLETLKEFRDNLKQQVSSTNSEQTQESQADDKQEENKSIQEEN